MNRAERRRQKKLADKVAKSANTTRTTSALSGQQQPATQKALNLAIQHLQGGNLNEANTAFQHVLEIDPEQPVALQFLGVIAHQQGNSDVAVELIKKAITVKPDYADAHSNLGLVQQERGNLDKADTCYHQAIAVNPNHPDALFNLGNLLKQRGKFEAAVASYQKALAVNPDYADIHYNLGATLHELARLDDAKASYQKALALNPDHANAHTNLGNVFLEQGHVDRAVTSYRCALSINPGLADAHSNLGNALNKMGNPDEAIIHYQKALSVNPDHADAHCNLGFVRQARGKIDDAVTSYRQAIAAKPNHVEALLNLGNLLKLQGNLDEACASFHKVIAINPGDAKAHCYLGNTLKALGQDDEAVMSYHRALSIDPDYADAHNDLGNAQLSLAALDEAVISYRAAIKADPNHPLAHCNLGAALYKLGDLDAAVVSCHRAISINPNYSDAHYNLGIILQELEQGFEAFQNHRRAATLNPQNSDAWTRMAQSLKSVRFSSIDDNLLSDILSLLEQPNVVRPIDVVRPALSALHCLSGFTRLVEQTVADDPDRQPFKDSAAQLSSIPLLLRLMGLCPINDIEIERMFTRLRRDLLTTVAEDDTDDEDNVIVLPFALALALHCFTNEYIYLESNDETQQINTLTSRIAALVKQKQAIPFLWLAALASFRPLHSLSYAEQLLDHDDRDILDELLRRQIAEPLVERALRQEIPQLTSIVNNISQLVQAQYEESPYPRWIHTRKMSEPQVLEDDLQKAPLSLDLGGYKSPANPEILIAGCGTGQHSLNTASRFKGAQVLAVDLSLSSLSYAIRKTQELGVENITYGQADIMELGSLGRQFDFIESAGVLHHLGDPMAGWKVLVDLLRPGGIMRIALYSQVARKAVVDGHALITDRGYTSSLEDIRCCRQEIIQLAEGGDQALTKVCDFPDFYSLSECRDLLFHVQEHRFTLPQIEEALANLNLSFLGIETETHKTLKTFRETYPEQTAATALSLWHQFEQNNPDTFRGMYQFWCRKI